jgi:formate hydrogenlyase subunit 3/multisubunit Na+/H+ antiporter MnhD subunit
MSPAQTVLYAINLCLVGAVFMFFVPLVAPGNRKLAGWFNFLITAVSSVMVLWAAGAVIGGHPSAVDVWRCVPLNSLLKIYVDGLAALFLGLVALIALLSSLYSITYMDHYKEYGVGSYYPWFLLFVGGMYGILTVTDLQLFFCAFWQLMTIPSFFLIRYEHRNRDNVRAAFKYLIMMEVACALVMMGSGFLASALKSGALKPTPSWPYDFDTLAANMMFLLSQKGAVAMAMLFFLVGFGIKAGMWPFGQMWLPDAHPAAPSPVSALLSGVMIKTGIYGLMRCFLWMAPQMATGAFSCREWGLTIAILGTITLFVGTAQALKQEQSKRLLAFHSIGQVGYILLGLGACLALMSEPHPGARAFGIAAFYGAIFHTLNHGVFKSLLFMNAGAMLYATGTQDLNRMGGLMKYMPVTALATLVASFSIAGVPLCNGFASKWSLYVATLSGSRWAPWLAVCAVIAILTSALTLASFMKFFGTSFLSRTSKLVDEKSASSGTLEVDMLMQIPQAILASLCLIMGMLPIAMNWLFVFALAIPQHYDQPVTLATALAGMSPTFDALNTVCFPNAPYTAAFFPPAIIVIMSLTFLVAYVVSRLGGAKRRTASIWLCGYAREQECHRYHAHGLYGEVKRYFRWVGGAPRHSSEPTKDHR